jgi:hypothetical protein
MKLFIYLTLAHIFFLGGSNVSAQTAAPVAGGFNSDFESVWLWKIITPIRTIYLAGEIHDHPLADGETVSDRLVEAAYMKASTVLLERYFLTQNNSPPLSDRISLVTWEALDRAIRKAIPIKVKEQKIINVEQQKVSVNQVVKYINNLPDYALVLNTLPDLLVPLATISDQQPRLENGFLKRTISENEKRKVDKIDYLETPDELIAAWSDNCSEPGYLEASIKNILFATGENSKKSCSTPLRQFRNSEINEARPLQCYRWSKKGPIGACSRNAISDLEMLIGLKKLKLSFQMTKIQF